MNRYVQSVLRSTAQPALHWAGRAAVSLGCFALLAHGPVHEQIRILDAQLATSPADAPLLVRRAELYRLDGGLSNAVADLKAAARLQPELEALWWVRSRVRLDLGEMEGAVDDLTRLIGRQPGNAGAFAERGRAHEARQRFAEAAADYSEAIRLMSSPDPDLYLARARAERRRGPGHLATALRGLDEGITRLGPLVTLQLEAVDLEVALGRTDEAVRRLRLLAGRSARKEVWLVREAEILQAAGHAEEAEKAWTDAYRACSALPPRLRQTRATKELESRITSALPPAILARLATEPPAPDPVTAASATTPALPPVRTTPTPTP